MVLVVDDSKINQLVVKKILEPLGYKIEAAMDGQAALRFLIESPTLPDVMLLDIVRPEFSLPRSGVVLAASCVPRGCKSSFPDERSLELLFPCCCR